MTNIHTATFQGKTFTRTSQSRTYTFCVAVVRPEWKRDGWTSPAWEGVETWSSTEALAQKAAATLRAERQFDGTEGRGHIRGRRFVSPKGNGPARYSMVVVLPVTLQTKTPKASTPEADLAKRKSLAARRASNSGTAAATAVREAPKTAVGRDGVDYQANMAAAMATRAWHYAGERLALDIPARDAEGAIVAPTVLDVQAGAAAVGLAMAGVLGDTVAMMTSDQPVGVTPYTDDMVATVARAAGHAAAAALNIPEVPAPARMPAFLTNLERLMGTFTFRATPNGVGIRGLSFDAALHLVQVHTALGEQPSMELEGGVLPPDGPAAVGTCWYCGGAVPAGQPCPACLDRPLTREDFFGAGR